MAFPKLKHFVASEFEYPNLIDETTLRQLDSMRDTLKGKVITINSDYRPGDKGWHGRGKAIDCVIRYRDTRQPLPIAEQLGIAIKFFWSAIGIYPFWNNPGLHLDTRPLGRFDRRPMWWRDKDGEYHYNLEAILCLESLVIGG